MTSITVLDRKAVFLLLFFYFLDLDLSFAKAPTAGIDFAEDFVFDVTTGGPSNFELFEPLAKSI